MKRIMGITLIIIGAVCLTMGILLLNKTASDTQVVCHHEVAQPAQATATKTESTDSDNLQPAVSASEDSNSSTARQTSSSTDHPSTEIPKTRSEEIGQAFENRIVNLLADSRFKLLDRTQDTKSTAGVYAESCMNPDLHIEQSRSPRPIDYYIECKYRSRWYDGKVQFEDYQVKRYKEFQGKQHRKVLFALGVGGTPDAPQELMIVPLDRLVGGAILESAHDQYKIEPTSDALYAYMDNYFKQVFATKRK